MELSTSVQYIKGVGPKTAQRFAKLGVETAGQLLELYPRDYVDYSRKLWECRQELLTQIARMGQ